MNKKEDDRIRVVMAGPLPPAIGGMSTIIKDIGESSIRDHLDLELLDTSKTTEVDRPIWKGIAARIRLLVRCARMVGGRKPTILHIHTCSGLSYFLDATLLMVAKLKSVPVVLHIHGAAFDAFLDGLPKTKQLIARWIARAAATVVVLSESWQSELSKRLPGSHLVAIENGVPVPEVVWSTVDPEGKKKILFLGNLCKRKGVWDLLEAMTKVEGNVELVLAGGEEDSGIGVRVEQAILEKKLEKKVRWIGPVSGKEKNTLIYSSHIFILPSYAEGLPIALLEAMCSGLPVIVTSVGAIPSVVEHGKQGIVLSPGDIDAIANSINQLLENEDIRRKYGMNAKNRCVEKYGMSRVVSQYLNLYKKILLNG